MKLRYRAIATLAIVLALTLTASIPVVAQDSGQAAVRIVHAVPGGPAVNVFVDGNQVFTNIAYKQVTSRATLSAGSHSVRIVPVNSQQALIDTTVTLQADTYNTIAAVGQPNSVQALTMTDSSTLPLPNQARVRLVHASPNAPAVDVAVKGGPTLFSNVSFPTATDYIVVGAQPYTVDILSAGTSNIVLTVPNVSLNGSTVYSIYAVGLLNGQPPLEVLVVIDAPLISTCAVVVAAQTPGPTSVAPTATGRVIVPGAVTSPTVSGTPRTSTPTVSGTPRTSTPTVSGTPGTSTPTVSGTPSTPAASATPRTSTPAASGTPVATASTPPATSAGTPAGGITPAATSPSGGATSSSGSATFAPSTPSTGG